MFESGISDLFIWLGIAFCLSQSAMFSGLNLALFGISRLRLEIEASAGSIPAQRILRLRQDANFLLTTILWGNVGINVLLTLLSNSVLAGVSAFFFSTIFITFFGEITPQAYFSRHAMQTGHLLAPAMRFYQVLLYPVAKPTALALDMWLGREGIHYFQESDLLTLLQKHIESSETDIDRFEGVGAMNFLALDDLMVKQEGEPVDPLSVVPLPHSNGQPQFPAISGDRNDAFIQAINASGKKWIIFTNETGEPTTVINTNHFLRHACLDAEPPDPAQFCHRPVVVHDTHVPLGKVLTRMFAVLPPSGSKVIEPRLLLVWTDKPRLITGTDILDRLLHGATYINGWPAR